MRTITLPHPARKLAGAVAAALAALHAGAVLGLDPSALPTNGRISSGAGSISQQGAAMTVTQTSDRLVALWDTFNIGSGARVDFLQPSRNSIALNRVMTGDPSRIYGQLNANGQVFLVNPSGVLFGAGASVNVGSLVASTLNISDADFNAGRLAFAREGAAGSVINQGSITAADGGYVALIGPQVRNEGSIRAAQGSIALGAGERVALDFHGDGLLSMDVSAATLGAFASNTGLLSAPGGQVQMSVRAADAALATVLNQSGVIEAQSLVERNGVIRLEGGDSGVVAVSGVLDASGRGWGETGGTVKVLGDKVGLFDGTRIDASGHSGGGTVLVGGNWQGSGAEQHASAVYMDPNAKIIADALERGNGGKVVLWSDEVTNFYGAISARGGAAGGNGGRVETSGKDYLEAQGSVDASAANGAAGTWLLDPRNVTISGATANGAFDGATPTNTFTPTANTATVNAATINTSLGGGTNVTVNTGSTGTQSGDITVTGAISKTTGADATLTLLAANSITVSTSITSTSNKLHVVLNADSDASGVGRVLLDSGGSIVTNGGKITIGGGADPLIGFATGPTGSNGFNMSSFTLNSGGGNISIRAAGPSGTNATSFGTAANTIQSGGGNISIVATTSGAGVSAVNNGSGSAVTISAGGGNILLDGSANGANTTTVAAGVNFTASGTFNLNTTGAGTITINGSNTGGGPGVNMTKTGNMTLQTAGGAITINGGANGVNIAPTAGTTAISSTGGGAITFTGDSIALGGAAGTVSVASSGALTLQPSSNSTTVGIGTGATGTFQLDAGEIGRLTDGFSSITIGSSTGTGAVAVNAAVFTDPLTIRQASGGIAFGGALTLGSNNLTLSSGGGAISGVQTASVGNVSITGAGAVSLGALNPTGALDISTTGAITQSGIVTVGGAATLAAGAANDITLNNTSNNFTSVAVGSGKDVSLADTNGIQLGTSNIAGSLGVQAGGQVSQSGLLTVGGGLSLTTSQVAGDVTLNNAGAAATVLGNTQIGNNYSLTTASGPVISQTGGTTLAIGNNFSVTGGTLPAPAAGNVIGGLDNSAGGGAVIKNVGVVDLSTRNIGGGAGNLTTAGNLSVQSLASAATIAAPVGAGTTAINLPMANNVGGAISISASAPTVTPSGSPVATGIVQNGATLSVGGSASFSAAASAANPGGAAGNILLDGTGNVFTGNLSFSGNDVTVKSAGALSLGASSASGLLNLTAASGDITGASALTVGGATTLTANGAGASVSLLNASNNFGGTVTLAGAGGLANVALRDSTSLDVQVPALSGSLSLTAPGATVTAAGPLAFGASSISGDLGVTANGAITQTGALGVTGNLTLATQHAAGDVAIDNTGAATTKLGASTVGGDFSVTAAGKTVSQNGGTAINVAGNFNVNATSSTILNANNIVGGADNSIPGGAIIKQVGVVTLGNRNDAGSLSVTSLASAASFAGPAVHGSAINLSNPANSIGGTISATTSAPAIVAGGAPVATGIAQAPGSSIQVAGASSFTTAGGDITLTNPGNHFTGAVTVAGGKFSVTDTGALSVISAGALSLGTVSAGGAFGVNAGGMTTLNGNITAAGNVAFTGGGAGAVALGGNVAIDAGIGSVTLGTMTGGANNLSLTANDVALGGNWSGTGSYLLRPTTLSQTVGLGGGTGSFNLSSAELANISSAGPSLVTIGRADGTGAITANAFSFNDPLAILGGAATFNGGAYALGGGLSLQSSGAVRLNGSAISAGNGNVSISGASSNATAAIALASSASISTVDGNISLSGSSSGGSAITLGGAGSTNVIQSTGAGNITLGANATSTSAGFGLQVGNSGTNKISVKDGALVITGQAANTNAASSSAVSIGSGTNTFEATGTGSITINGAASGGSGFAMNSGGTNTVSTTSGALTVAASAIAGDAISLGSASTNNTIATSAGGSILLTGVSTSGVGMQLATSNHTIKADGAGSITINATSTSASGGIGFSMGTGGNSLIQVADGTLAINGRSAGASSAIGLGSGTNLIQATGTGSVILTGNATGAGAAVLLGSGGNNTVQTVSGALSLAGNAASGDGVRASGNGNSTVKTTTGAITLSGASATGDAIAFAPTGGLAQVRATGAGSIAFIGDSMSASSAGGAIQFAGSGGELIIRQRTSGTSIGIGDGSPGTLNWSSAEVALVQAGFSQIRIGDAQSGKITLAVPSGFPAPVVLPPATLSDTDRQQQGVIAAAFSGSGVVAPPGTPRFVYRDDGRLTLDFIGGDDAR